MLIYRRHAKEILRLLLSEEWGVQPKMMLLGRHPSHVARISIPFVELILRTALRYWVQTSHWHLFSFCVQLERFELRIRPYILVFAVYRNVNSEHIGNKHISLDVKLHQRCIHYKCSSWYQWYADAIQNKLTLVNRRCLCRRGCRSTVSSKVVISSLSACDQWIANDDFVMVSYVIDSGRCSQQ